MSAQYAIAMLPFLFILTGCKEARDDLYLKVMEIHDEVMPLTGDISRMSRTLKKELPTLDSIRKEEYIDVIHLLETAEDTMMSWMAAFKPPTTDDPHRSIYLQKEKNKITEISQMMHQSLERAKSLTKNE